METVQKKPQSALQKVIEKQQGKGLKKKELVNKGNGGVVMQPKKTVGIIRNNLKNCIDK